MVLSPEFSLLVLACRDDDEQGLIGRAEKLIDAGSLDWDCIYRLADRLSVRPQLARLLAKLSQEKVPEVFRARINKAYLDTVHDQVTYAAEYLKINSILMAEGIPAVPFKGFWLAHEYYGNLGEREAGDTDVFTEFRHLKRIREIMLANGYSVEPQMAGFSMDDLAGRAGEYNFDRTEEGQIVSHIEFHWRMCSPVYDMGISYGDLSPQITEGSFQGAGLKVFTPSAAFLLAVLHHGGKDPFNELKYVLDFTRILRRESEIDWKWVLDTARRLRAERLVYVAVGLAHELLGVTVPVAVERETLSSGVRRLTRNRIRFMANALEYWHPRIFVNDWLFRIRSRNGRRIKWQFSIYIIGILMKRLFSSRRGVSTSA